MRPRLLDLYCKAGGAGMGFHMAGFDVVGVDKEPQPRYPFRFFQFDITQMTRRRAREIRYRFDAIHASPPCQAYSDLRVRWPGREYPELIGLTREILEYIGLPYVIENVEGAPLHEPTKLCGSSFGLRVRRHRLFETNWELDPLACEHSWQDRHRPYLAARYHSGKEVTRTGTVGVYGGGRGNGPDEVTMQKVAMGIDWMTQEELNQAIPPAYTRYIGKQLLEAL